MATNPFSRIAVALLLVVVSAPAARSESNVRDEMSVVAGQLAKILKDHQATEVDFAEFLFSTADSKLKSSGGAGIAQILAEELHREGVAVRRGSALRISCQYDDVIDSRSKSLAARIRGEVRSADGRVMTTFSRGAFGDAALSSLFGSTANLPPKAEFAERDKRLTLSLDAPAVHVEGARVQPEEGTPYAMELLTLVKDQYEPREARVVDGQAYVTVKPDETFAVRLYNGTAFDAAVYLAVDGVPMFTFSSVPGYGQVIVPARSSALVQGWFLGGNPLIEKFRPGVYPNGGVLRDFPKTNGPGVVTAVFSMCWSQDAVPPDDEPRRFLMRSVALERQSRELRIENYRTENSSEPASSSPDFTPPDVRGKSAPPPEEPASAEIPSGCGDESVPPRQPVDDAPPRDLFERDEPEAALAEIPDGAPKRDEDRQSSESEPAIAEIPPPPLFAQSRCVRRDFGTRFRAEDREFGVVRTVISIRYEK